MSASIEAIDAQWTNVQDPVKQMITAITKAVRTQSAGIKACPSPLPARTAIHAKIPQDLDRRIDGVPTIDAMEARVQEVARQFALQLETDVGSVRDSLKRKADISDLSTLEKNTISMAKQLDKVCPLHRSLHVEPS